MTQFSNPQSNVLLIGLGNWKATPDSLGPRVVEFSPITRHLHKYAPDALIQGMRPVCGLAPGVLGTTGIETNEIIKGIVENVKPDLLIVVDALAAQSTERIGTSIQISNTGIQPGSGVGNAREPINQQSLGIPVIAIGVPTVVSAATIANQAIQHFCQNSGANYQQQVALNSIRSVLSYFGGSLTVTPKEVDDLIDNAASIVSPASPMPFSRHPKTVLVIIRPTTVHRSHSNAPGPSFYLRPSLEQLIQGNQPVALLLTPFN